MTRLEAERGLALLHYPGTWHRAKILAEKEWYITQPKYWETARQIYLQLGGKTVEQLSEEQREAYREVYRVNFQPAS